MRVPCSGSRRRSGRTGARWLTSPNPSTTPGRTGSRSRPPIRGSPRELSRTVSDMVDTVPVAEVALAGDRIDPVRFLRRRRHPPGVAHVLHAARAASVRQRSPVVHHPHALTDRGLSFLVRQAHRAFLARLADRLVPHGVSVPEWAVFAGCGSRKALPRLISPIPCGSGKHR